ncbi:hypothetical protein C0J52_13782 [Blattella germanica]|nr:hypothetical protein C0J52_13782 [Blattella germanica]
MCIVTYVLDIDIVCVSEKATNPRNHITDTTAVVEICNILNREPYCAHVATRVIANKIQSPQEWEALQALNLLDTCMKHCGVGFHAEVGKFRFLNEMIKLVSPKYLGGRTAVAVRQRVLLLMHTWTEEPPYISSSASSNQKEVAVPPPAPRPRNSIFEDEERSRLLQKLLQSKNPDDLQAANRLIKTMVKEDEYRVEMNSRRITELESVHNNVRLLSEMLDQYRPGQTSSEELELIKELHQSCERLRPSVFRLASETQDNEAMLNEVLSASDELGQVFDKYTAIIVQGKRPPPQTTNSKSGSTSLLDLSTPSEEKLPPVPIELLSNQLADLGLDLSSQQSSATRQPAVGITDSKQSNLEALGDIFASVATPKPPPSLSTISPSVNSILQPVTVQNSSKAGTSPTTEPEKPSKLKALEDLDALGESLLKQSLPSSCAPGSQFTRPLPKVPMNLLGSQSQVSSESNSLLASLGASGDASSSTNLDLDFLIGDSTKSKSNEATSGPGGGGTMTAPPDFLNGSIVNGGGDDSMVDLTEDTTETQHEETGSGPGSIKDQNNRLAEALLSASARHGSTSVAEGSTLKTQSNDSSSASTASSIAVSNGNANVSSAVNSPSKRIEVKPLTDISVSLESIKPGTIPPLTVLDEKNGITVILNFAKDSPRPDVSVVVVTTISKNSSPISSYLFQAVVPKDPVSLKFMVSYTVDDETVTEMGEVERLPTSA